MNLPLEIKKKKVEILRVEASRAEQELKIEEYLEHIERLKLAMKTQDEHVEKLKKEISDLEARKE